MLSSDVKSRDLINCDLDASTPIEPVRSGNCNVPDTASTFLLTLKSHLGPILYVSRRIRYLITPGIPRLYCNLF